MFRDGMRNSLRIYENLKAIFVYVLVHVRSTRRWEKKIRACMARLKFHGRASESPCFLLTVSNAIKRPSWINTRAWSRRMSSLIYSAYLWTLVECTFSGNFWRAAISISMLSCTPLSLASTNRDFTLRVSHNLSVVLNSRALSQKLGRYAPLKFENN